VLVELLSPAVGFFACLALPKFQAAFAGALRCERAQILIDADSSLDFPDSGGHLSGGDLCGGSVIEITTIGAVEAIGSGGPPREPRLANKASVGTGYPSAFRPFAEHPFRSR
jgi:hypothetical protein